VRNGVYLACSFAALFLIVRRLWSPFQPAIVLFCFVLQWVQIVAFVFWMNYQGIDINTYWKRSSIAVLESLIGLVLMAFLFSSLIQNNYRFQLSELKTEVAKWSPRKVFLLYLVSVFSFGSIGFVFGQTSGFAQILITLESLKWVFFLIFGMIVWLTSKYKNLFAFVCLYEFVSAFYSYFSDFKLVIFYLVLIVACFSVKVRFKQFFLVSILGVILGGFFLTWTAIKGDYRKYLSSGKRQQKVTVTREEAYSNISNQLDKLSYQKYERAVLYSFYRLQYVLHLSRVMDRIPTTMPHENGRLWISNLKFVFTPRFLFPEKEIYDPSLKTNKYTGFRYATGKDGAAFSLGYFSESYVDFGHVIMYVPLLIIAFALAGIYNYFLTRRRLNLLFRYAIISTILLSFSNFEVDGIFLVGRVVVSSLVMMVLTLTVFPVIQNWAYRV
jgi:hypothetical protein